VQQTHLSEDVGTSKETFSPVAGHYGYIDASPPPNETLPTSQETFLAVQIQPVNAVRGRVASLFGESNETQDCVMQMYELRS